MLQLEQQMVSLVSSTQNMQTQMVQLQNRLQEEHQRNRRQVDEIENLRSKLLDLPLFMSNDLNNIDPLSSRSPSVSILRVRNL